MKSNSNKKKKYQVDEYYIDLQRKAQSLEIIDKDATSKKPFPGLRPFSTAEAHLFFGREGLSSEVLKMLLTESNFLAILGASGSGKSSLIRAGLIPNLHAGKWQEENSNWRIVICRPGNNPIGNLAAALTSTKLKDNLDQTNDFNTQADVIYNTLCQSSYGILEVLESFNDIYEKTLIVIDQFEELFRFNDNNSVNKQNNARFVDLLLTASKLRDSMVYVIITMRSEFLGECVKFRNLPEAINKGQYLVPRLSAKNISDTIEGPIAVVDKEISQRLVNQMVNEIGDDMDQLPVLQHSLMRTYNFAFLHDSDKQKIEIEDYEAIGTMEMALSNHATKIFNGLKEENSKARGLSRKQRIAKLIFQRLTDESKGSLGGRFPTTLSKIYSICKARPLKASKKEVKVVINEFRGLDTSFLMPPIDTALTDDLVIDISHESLMRNWDLLIGNDKQIGWIQEEVENGKRYRQLHERRIQGDPIISSLLDDLLVWKKNNSISSTWAKRYVNTEDSKGDFDKNMKFIEESDAYRNDLREKETSEAIKKVKFQNNLIKAGIVVFVALIGLFIFGFMKAIDAKEAKEKADNQRILSIFETLKRSNPTISFNSATRWRKLTGKGFNKEFEFFIDNFDTRNSYLINTLPLSSPLLSIEYSDIDQVEVKEKLSSSIWNVNHGILKSKKGKKNSGFEKEIIKKIVVKGNEYSVVFESYKSIAIIDQNNKTLARYKSVYKPRNIDISKEGKYILIDNKIYDFLSRNPNKIIYEIFDSKYRNRVSKIDFINEEIWKDNDSIRNKFSTKDYAAISTVRFLNDDTHIAAVYFNGLIQIINFKQNTQTRKGKLVAAFNYPILRSISTMAIDSTNQYIIVGSYNNIDVWKIGALNDSLSNNTIVKKYFKEKPHAELIGHTGSVNCLSISPNNNFLLSGSDDKLAMLWDLNKGERISILRGNNFPIKFVGFSNSGKEMFTSDLNFKFSIWKRGNPTGIGTLMKISPFDLYKRGITTIKSDGEDLDLNAYDLYNINNDENLNVEKTSGDVLHYILSLPKKNLYPEDTTYSKGINKSLKEIHSIFYSIVENPAFRDSVSLPFRDLLFKEHMELELRKDDLLFKSDSIAEELSKSKLLIESLNYNLKDASNFQTSINYANQLIDITLLFKGKYARQASKNIGIAEKASFDFAPVQYSDSVQIKNLWTKIYSYYCNTRNYPAADKLTKKLNTRYAKENMKIGKLWVQFYQRFALGRTNRIASYRMSDLIIDEKILIQNKEKYLKNYSFWWERSWNALFAKEYKVAIESARKTLALKPKATQVETNIALGYLLSNQWKKAEQVYLKWKDKPFNTNGTISNVSFLKDIKDLEKSGIYHPDFEKVKKLFASEKK